MSTTEEKQTSAKQQQMERELAFWPRELQAAHLQEHDPIITILSGVPPAFRNGWKLGFWHLIPVVQHSWFWQYKCTPAHVEQDIQEGFAKCWEKCPETDVAVEAGTYTRFFFRKRRVEGQYWYPVRIRFEATGSEQDAMCGFRWYVYDDLDKTHHPDVFKLTAHFRFTDTLPKDEYHLVDLSAIELVKDPCSATCSLMKNDLRKVETWKLLQSIK